MKKIEILECTLRDGSYPIDYQFTAKDTAVIAKALENLGFRYIEIGHGLGLNASSSKGKAAETDETYLRTAQVVLTKAKFGMFFIPGIGRLEDINLAAKHEMGFIRVGTNVSEVEKGEKYIKYAKDLGMEVSSNLMKSYALPPEKYIGKAKLVEKYGADIICLVDSAGGMLPPDIKNYIEIMKKAEISAKIGFHGHNNLLMGVANALEAVNCGATIIDTSLKGIGRSAGNVPTEIFLAVLMKKGHDLGIDIFKTMDIAEELAKDIMNAKVETDPIAITAGLAEFHSSFLNTIYKASKKYSVDPRRLIISVSEVDKINVPEELAMKMAKQLQIERAAFSEISTIDIPEKFEIPRGHWDNQLSLQEKVKSLSNQIKNQALKTGKQTIFLINISALYDVLNMVLPYIHETSSYVMGSCEMTDEQKIIEVVKIIDGKIDYIVIDDEKKKKKLFDIYKTIKGIAKESSILTYKGNRVWIQTIENMVSSIRGEMYEAKIGIIGLNEISVKLAISFSERGSKVFIYDKHRDDQLVKAANQIKISRTPYIIKKIRVIDEFSKNLDILIGLDRAQKINKKMIENMNSDGIIIDAIFDSIEVDALDYGQKQNMRIFKVDIKAAMAGEMTTVLRTNSMLKDTGVRYIEDVRIITPTFIGRKGDIIVDSILKPTEVFGVADGRGFSLNDITEYNDLIRKVELELIKRRMDGK